MEIQKIQITYSYEDVSIVLRIHVCAYVINYFNNNFQFIWIDNLLRPIVHLCFCVKR